MSASHEMRQVSGCMVLLQQPQTPHPNSTRHVLLLLTKTRWPKPIPPNCGRLPCFSACGVFIQGVFAFWGSSLFCFCVFYSMDNFCYPYRVLKFAEFTIWCQSWCFKLGWSGWLSDLCPAEQKKTLSHWRRYYPVWRKIKTWMALEFLQFQWKEARSADFWSQWPSSIPSWTWAPRPLIWSQQSLQLGSDIGQWFWIGAAN